MIILQVSYVYERSRGTVPVQLQPFARRSEVLKHFNCLLNLICEFSYSSLYPVALEPYETELDLPVSAV